MRLFPLFSLALVSAAVACGSEAGVPDPEPAPGATTETPAAPTRPPFEPNMPEPAGPASEGLGAPYPVVLMHGMAGFGKLEVGPVGITYFDGVVADLAKRGEAVYTTTVPPFDTSDARAKALTSQIDEILKRTGKAKVNLVGHSQGGMDARVITSPAGLGYGNRVASVTTIATPHRGSKVADLVLGLLKGVPASVIDDVTGSFLGLVQKTAYELDADAHLRAQVSELSEDHMTKVFNPKYVDAPGVLYMSYAGRTNLRTGIGVCDGGKYPNNPLDVDAAQAALAPMALFLEEGKLKINDGLVTVESAKWGQFQECVPADHLKEVGQLGPAAASFDHLQMFRNIVTRIRAAGL
ncbi:MAG: alpha/beta fold hydrolase [Deltaproteobacteria bacterium]|nr:alpha/beta fold hydrolase [Deltaproteobacteria bacterium]